MSQSNIPAFPSSAFPQLLTNLMQREINRVDQIMSARYNVPAATAEQKSLVLRCSLCHVPDSETAKVATVGGEPFCYHCAQEVCG